ncbi:hypothetical protein CsSME_00035579 [Camellia sinensis var. sinensis]
MPFIVSKKKKRMPNTTVARFFGVHQHVRYSVRNLTNTPKDLSLMEG